MKYAVIVEKSVYHEGDERSRTNPGHGYGARTEEYKSLETFKTQAEMLEWVTKYGKHEKYQAIEFNELEIVTEVKVKQTVVQRTITESDLGRYARRKDFS